VDGWRIKDEATQLKAERKATLKAKRKAVLCRIVVSMDLGIDTIAVGTGSKQQCLIK
jgi:hypothetical protein